MSFESLALVKAGLEYYIHSIVGKATVLAQRVYCSSRPSFNSDQPACKAFRQSMATTSTCRVELMLMSMEGGCSSLNCGPTITAHIRKVRLADRHWGIPADGPSGLSPRGARFGISADPESGPQKPSLPSCQFNVPKKRVQFIKSH